MVFPPDEEEIDLNLPIFEASNDDASIVVNVNHQVLEADDKAISIAEIYEIENTGNKIFTGKGEPGSEISKTLKFYIPNEALNMNFIEGIQPENIIREKDTIYDTVSFPPGKKRFVITYNLPLSFGKNVLDKELFYKTETMLVLAAESENKFSIEGLKEMEPIFIDNMNYQRWVGEKIDSNSNIRISYFSTNLEFKTIELYPIFIFTILFIVSVVFGLFKSDGKKVYNNYESLMKRRGKIIYDIAELDIKHDNKEIDYEEYRFIRSELKKSLVLLEKLLRKP